MFWWNQIRKSNHLLPLLIITFVLLWVVWPLFHSGFFQSDDGEWMIIRFSAFHQALRDGQFPIRFLGRLNYGYGYPVANFLYPGFMYLAEPIHLLGFGFVDTIKIILGASMIGSAIFTYFWLAKVFKRWEAVVGSLFYLLMPYHLYDLYRRGSVGEILALAVVPFIFWQVERKSLFWMTIGIAFLILSHNTLALLFLPIILIYAFFRKILNTYHLILATILGLGLSAFFWIPAIFDLQYTRFSQTQVSNWQDYFVDFNLIGWGTLAVFPLVTFIIFLKRRKIISYWLFLLFLVVGIGSIFLSLSQSRFLWQILPVSFVQFPFRFLSITTLSGAYLAAYLLDGVNGQKRWLMAAIVAVMLLFSAIPYTRLSEFFDKGEGFYSTNEGTTTVQDEYMPKWVKIKPTQRFKEKVEIVSGNAMISNLVYNSKKIEFNIDSVSDSRIRINTVYFPGWKVFIDGKESAIDYNNDFGVMDLQISKGEYRVKSIFTETSLRLLADTISIISVLFLIARIRFRI